MSSLPCAFRYSGLRWGTRSAGQVSAGQDGDSRATLHLLPNGQIALCAWSFPLFCLSRHKCQCFQVGATGRSPSLSPPGRAAILAACGLEARTPQGGERRATRHRNLRQPLLRDVHSRQSEPFPSTHQRNAAAFAAYGVCVWDAPCSSPISRFKRIRLSVRRVLSRSTFASSAVISRSILFVQLPPDGHDGPGIQHRGGGDNGHNFSDMHPFLMLSIMKRMSISRGDRPVALPVPPWERGHPGREPKRPLSDVNQPETIKPALRGP